MRRSTLLELADAAGVEAVLPRGYGSFTSNVMLSVVPSIDRHALPALLAHGVPCTINADDPLLFDSDLLTEYELCRDQLGLTDGQLAQCARTSLLSSGAPRTRVREALDGIDAWLRRPAVDADSPHPPSGRAGGLGVTDDGAVSEDEVVGEDQPGANFSARPAGVPFEG